MSTITLEYPLIKEGMVEKKELVFSESLLNEPYNKASLFVIQVDGESMQPMINDKALVVADISQKEFAEEGIFLVEFEEKMWIKQAKTVEGRETFVSINPKFSHLVYEFAQVRVIAKAVLTFTAL